MPGPPPKPRNLRQRKNRVPGAAMLPAAGSSLPAPPLPERGEEEEPWHPESEAYWAEVWASPMATEYLPADVPGLVGLFKLVDRFNYGEYQLAAEIRLQRVCFGLTPIDRRRLQWEVEKVEQIKKGRVPTPAHARKAAGDPLRFLKAVK